MQLRIFLLISFLTASPIPNVFTTIGEFLGKQKTYISEGAVKIGEKLSSLKGPVASTVMVVSGAGATGGIALGIVEAKQRSARARASQAAQLNQA